MLIYIVLCYIGRINKQFVWRVYQQNVLISECNKVNVIKELLSVEYNFATVPVLDLADVIFSAGIETLCTE